MHSSDEPRRNAFAGPDCDELLKTLDFVTVTYIQRALEAPQMSREFTPAAGFFNSIHFPKGRHWLWLCSSKARPGFKWVPARIQLRHNSFIVPVLPREDSIARVHFPQELCNGRTDLDHLEIHAIFTQLAHPAEVAQEMLERVKGNSRSTFKPYDGFIDAVIVLMFGVEAGRNCSAFATSLMLLELIAAQHPHADQCNQPFTLANAFRCEGGKRPMAGIREELTVMRHWLDLTELLGDYNQLSVKGRILKLLRTYLG